MADEAQDNTNTSAAASETTTQGATNQAGSEDTSTSSGAESVAVEAVEPTASVVASAPSHVEVAFTDRAVLLFEELVRHIKSEETALVDGIDSALADLVAKVRG